MTVNEFNTLSIVRERSVPSGAVKEVIKDLNLVVYRYHSRGNNCAIGFSAKRKKPDFRYRFGSEQQREKYISDWVENNRLVVEEKNKRNTERKNFCHTLNVGDVLYASWGYDQTNIDFFEVVSVKSKKSVVIRELAQENDHSGDMSGCTMPIRGEYCDDAITKRVNIGNRIKLDCSRTASCWDGKPKYYTSYA